MANNPLKPVTALVKSTGASTTTRKLNALLLREGYLETRSRPSTSDPSKTKTYSALTGKGLEYGENVANNYTEETSPRYYEDRFDVLLGVLGIARDP